MGCKDFMYIDIMLHIIPYTTFPQMFLAALPILYILVDGYCTAAPTGRHIHSFSIIPKKMNILTEKGKL